MVLIRGNMGASLSGSLQEPFNYKPNYNSIKHEGIQGVACRDKAVGHLIAAGEYRIIR